MKHFFISLLATVVGILITFLLIIAICLGIFSFFANSFDEKSFKVKSNSVLHIKFDNAIKERTSNNPLESLNWAKLQSDQSLGLNDILKNIKKAKSDTSIKGIYLDVSVVPAGIATIEEIRNAFIDFKESKKFIISYSEVYTQGAYYLASVADKIYLNPEGLVEWKGLSAQLLFFKGLLNKLGVEMQIFKHGKFKSAVEPFDLEKMSDANRKQIRAYVGSIWQYIVENIAKERGQTIEQLNYLADNMLISNADSTLKYKLTDGLKYKDEVISLLKQTIKINEEDKINFVSLENYDDTADKNKSKTKQKIAIIYAVGGIGGGEGDEESIGSETISKTIREARLDTTVKSIVLRVNSPGGSALASDVIWREVVLAKKSKPVVVSMGDVAASGGYYIACAADAIVAQPNTITGSIGVFGILPNVQNFLKDKIGITTDTFNTNKFSDIGTTLRQVKPQERIIIQKSIEQIYDDFITKVAEGRKMSKAEIDSIGQGRVWSGINAKENGLVDEIGGIGKAIELAALKANLKDYKLVELPKQKDPIEQLLKELSGEKETKLLERELGSYYSNYKQIKQMLNTKGVQARMPYDIAIY